MTTKMVYASEAAALLGLNPYASKEEVLERIVTRVPFRRDPQSDEERKAVEPYKEQLKELVESNRSARVQRGLRAVTRAIEDEQVKEWVKKWVYTERGRLKEKRALEMLREERGLDVKVDERFAVRFCFDHRFVFKIGGRIDGYIMQYGPDKHFAIVEVKTRQSKFLGVTPYDNVQVQIYMHMFKAPVALLVELFDDELRVHEIFADPAFIRDQFIAGVSSALQEKLAEATLKRKEA